MQREDTHERIGHLEKWNDYGALAIFDRLMTKDMKFHAEHQLRILMRTPEFHTRHFLNNSDEVRTTPSKMHSFSAKEPLTERNGRPNESLGKATALINRLHL